MTQIFGLRMSECLNFQNINVWYRLDADVEREMQNLFAHLRQKFCTSKQRNPSRDVGKAKNGPLSTVYKAFLSLSFFAVNTNDPDFWTPNVRVFELSKHKCLISPWRRRRTQNANPHRASTPKVLHIETKKSVVRRRESKKWTPKHRI